MPFQEKGYSAIQEEVSQPMLDVNEVALLRAIAEEPADNRVPSGNMRNIMRDMRTGPKGLAVPERTRDGMASGVVSESRRWRGRINASHSRKETPRCSLTMPSEYLRHGKPPGSRPFMSPGRMT